MILSELYRVVLDDVIVEVFTNNSKLEYDSLKMAPMRYMDCTIKYIYPRNHNGKSTLVIGIDSL